MNKYEKIIGMYFKEVLPLAQCRYNMYYTEDIYYRIPQLVYRLSNDIENQEIYNIIKKCIESFEGNLKWTEFESLYNKKVFNHSIAPLSLYNMQKENFIVNKCLSEKEYFGEERYQLLCEKAIEDIPALYKHIKIYLPKKLK